jgi:hypothetical protein
MGDPMEVTTAGAVPAAPAAAKERATQAAPKRPAVVQRGAAASSAAWAAPAARPPWEKADAARRQQTDDRKLLQQTAKLALATARITRGHQAALQHTALLPAGLPLVVALQEEGQRFYARHTEDRQQHKSGVEAQQGSPHVALWKVLVKLLMADSDGTPEGSALAAHAVRAEADQEYVEGKVYTCRIAAAHKADTAKLTLAVSDELRGVLAVVIIRLKQLGASWMLGAPPRGPIEREVERLLARSGA